MGWSFGGRSSRWRTRLCFLENRFLFLSSLLGPLNTHQLCTLLLKPYITLSSTSLCCHPVRWTSYYQPQEVVASICQSRQSLISSRRDFSGLWKHKIAYQIKRLRRYLLHRSRLRHVSAGLGARGRRRTRRRSGRERESSSSFGMREVRLER